MNTPGHWKRISCFLQAMIWIPFFITGQVKLYEINTTSPEHQIYSKLKMGTEGEGTGKGISLNNEYISINNKPFIPVTGEFHFSRYPKKYWDESIKKMKAGGINCIATYVFWNLHEEHEGIFNWENDRNLRRFIELCAENNLYVIVRIGPFCHGEIRNGGLPDWLLGKPVSIRSNDPGYLSIVAKWYYEVGQQLKGLYFKDRGPVIGVQLENEYQHSAAPWGLTYPGQPYDWTAAGRDLATTHEGVTVSTSKNQYAEEGNAHMRKLKELALKAGIDVPIYTATGWGYAAVIPNETLPVTAAYPYPAWTAKNELSPFYLYKDIHKDPDYSPVRYIPEDYPVFSAEIGCGIMSTYSRRPVVPANSTDALINRFLGSGANGIGYYMFHGGSTPKGDFYFNDEAYGYPKISYDFQAPIGEYGDIRPSFQRLKLLHFFINEFADILAPMQTVLPPGNALAGPGDSSDLRYAARVHNGSGFIFLNNFQDHLTMPDQKDLQLKISTTKGDIRIPETGGFSLKSGENAIFPFNLDMDGINLNYASAQLLMKGENAAHPYYVFFVPEGVIPEFSFTMMKGLKIKGGQSCQTNENKTRLLVKCKGTAGLFSFTLIRKNGGSTKIIVVPKAKALESYIANIGGEKHIVFSTALILQNKDSLEFLSDNAARFSFEAYPALGNPENPVSGKITTLSDPLFSAYDVSLQENKPSLQIKTIDEKRMLVNIPDQLAGDINDVFLKIDYTGDTGMGFLNGELVTDEFYKGIPWKIGLKRFIKPCNKEILFYFRPIYKNAPFVMDLDPAAIPDFSKQEMITQIRKVSVIPEYKTVIRFDK